MHSRNDFVNVELSDGTIIKMEYAAKGTQEISKGGKVAFSKIKKAIQSMAQDLNDIWTEVQPSKLAVEFGVEIEAGTDNTVTALFLKGSANANFKVTLEWEKDKSNT